MYIVFKTNNTVNKKFYYGIHESKTTSFDYYIGEGVNIKDPYTYQFSKTKLQQEVKQYGVKAFTREIIDTFDNESDALICLNKYLTPSILSQDITYNSIIDMENNLPIYEYEYGGMFIREITTKSSILRNAAMIGYPLNNKYYSLYKDTRFDRAKCTYIKKRMVYKYSCNGEFIKGYDSEEEARKDNKWCNITKSIKLKTADVSGHIWGLDAMKRYNAPKKHRVFKYSSAYIKKLRKNNLLETLPDYAYETEMKRWEKFEAKREKQRERIRKLKEREKEERRIKDAEKNII